MADTDIAFELYKMEYEKGAERYENIYKSVWTNFNYLVLLAGGILAFSNNVKFIPTWATIILAALPLLYWYVAVFTPHNKYGDQVVRRLSRVEQILNDKYAEQLSVGTCLSPPGPAEPDCGLQHFILFNNRPKGWFPPPVRSTTFAAFIGILAITSVGVAYSLLSPPNPAKAITVSQEQDALQVKVNGVNLEELRKISEANEQTRRELKQELEQIRSSLEPILKQMNAPLGAGQPGRSPTNSNANGNQ